MRRHDLYTPPDIIRMTKSRKMSWAGHVAGMEKNVIAFRVLVGTREGKRPPGRPRHGLEGDIKLAYK
jgi:hypothetical protein